MKISGTERGAGRILIRRSSLDDLPHLIAISQASIYAAHWTEQQWRNIFHTQIPPRLAWMAWDLGVPNGPSSELDFAQSSAQSVPSAGKAVLPAPEGAVQSRASLPSSAAVGFLVAQCGGLEWELENMAVLPALRRRGAGVALLGALLAEARAQQAERILLEVRSSNQPAISLYQQAGFELQARRSGYYRDPVEDALILVRVL